MKQKIVNYQKRGESKLYFANDNSLTLKIVKLRFLNCQKRVELEVLYMANYNSLVEDCQTKKSELLEKS